MGTISSYFTRKSSSSRIESDPFIVSSASGEGMAEGKPRDVTRQHTPEACITQDDFRRYANALQVAQEFVENGGMIMERQRILETELETCHERLRRFTEDHARVSESGTENISSSNRPSALERNYQQFYDHERMDSVDVIESSRIQKEQTKWTGIYDQRVACIIFEESFAAAEFLRDSFFRAISWILTSAPAIGAQYSEPQNEKGDFWFSIKTDGRHQGRSLDHSSVNSLKVIMKETAESCDIGALVETTFEALFKRQEKGRFQDYTRDILTNPKMIKYVEKCCRYAWKLVCQTPPYMIEGNSALQKSHVFNPAVHQVYRELASSERNSEFIHFVVWPGLFNGSSGRVIRKTEVVLKSQ